MFIHVPPFFCSPNFMLHKHRGHFSLRFLPCPHRVAPVTCMLVYLLRFSCTHVRTQHFWPESTRRKHASVELPSFRSSHMSLVRCMLRVSRSVFRQKLYINSCVLLCICSKTTDTAPPLLFVHVPRACTHRAFSERSHSYFLRSYARHVPPSSYTIMVPDSCSQIAAVSSPCPCCPSALFYVRLPSMLADSCSQWPALCSAITYCRKPPTKSATYVALRNMLASRGIRRMNEG